MRQVAGRLVRLIRQVRRAAQFEVHAFWRKRPIRPGSVMYESFAGNGMLCNPEAIFRELLGAPDMQDLQHVWAIEDPHRYRGTIAEFATSPNVRFVRYRSAAYFRALATSEFLVNNATFPTEFSKRPGQTYLNTWHGTPLKHMGYDMPHGALDAANTQRNFVAADFLLAANSFMAERMYEEAYKLTGVYRGLIIEEGYPRIDRQFLDETRFLHARAHLEAAGIELGSRDIVLYAPTWKGDSFAAPDDDVAELVTSVQELQHHLGADRYVVLLKTHQIVHRYAAANRDLQRILVPNEMPTNVVLGLSATLVTDYSSTFFDFLATGRPIVFYTPDMDLYSGTRGVYFPPEDWPGPVRPTMAEVAREIRARAKDGDDPYSPVRAEWRARFAADEVGQSSRRVVDVVFRGHRRGYRVRPVKRDRRQSVLLYLGGMRPNGITGSALNLLNSIDHEAYDVSVVFAFPRGSGQRTNQARINRHVRQFARVGGMNGSKIAHLRRKIAERRGRTDLHRSDRTTGTLWDDEWTRCFGDARFDALIDFSGYSPFWATLLLHAPTATRSIWLHNDMAAEVHRTTHGRKRMLNSLPAVFALYREFDRLVSVSASLNVLNREALGRYCSDPARFVVARNLLDTNHVLTGAKANLRTLAEHRIGETEQIEVPDWVGDLLAEDKKVWFVTVGRFSPEKNQARLVRAFARVHAERPETRLIMVGYGPLRDRLERQIGETGLADAAVLVGPYANPFPIMAAADCFVLSSNYEGQPMVLLEAATLGLPIVSVDFDSVHDALPNGSMSVVSQDDAALAEGMLAFVRGEVPRSSINAVEYNRAAVAEFAQATDPTPSRRSAIR